MSEKSIAVKLAERVLNEPNADPDADILILARQFLRSRETIERLEKELVYDPMADLIEANRDQILKMHEEAVSRINKVLIGGGPNHDAEKLVYIGRVLHALSVFHPMHCESWIGWPDTEAQQ